MTSTIDRDAPILPAQPPLHPTSPDSFVDEKELPTTDSENSSLYDKSSVAPLAPAVSEPSTPGDAILRYVGLRKRRAVDSLDAVSSVFHSYPVVRIADAHSTFEKRRLRRVNPSTTVPSLNTTPLTPSGRTSKISIPRSDGLTEKRRGSCEKSTGRSSSGCASCFSRSISTGQSSAQW